MKRKWLRYAIVLAIVAGLLVCAGQIVVVEWTFHPARRPLLPAAEAMARQTAATNGADFNNVSITAQDGIVLRAWSIHPRIGNANAVLILHGQSDNRFSQMGYAQILLHHGYSVLMPDARAHGTSGGELATYGLLESDDVRRWFEWLTSSQHPHCIFGFGESMGAAQMLQALSTEPHFCAVAVESPFASFREIAYDRVGQFFHTGPWLGRTLLRPVVEVGFLCIRWKFRLNMQQVSPENVVAVTNVPVFLIHGQIDSNIPLRHSRRIHASNPNVVLWEVPKTDHCGALSAAPEEFQSRLLAWFDTSGKAH